MSRIKITVTLFVEGDIEDDEQISELVEHELENLVAAGELTYRAVEVDDEDEE